MTPEQWTDPCAVWVSYRQTHCNLQEFTQLTRIKLRILRFLKFLLLSSNSRGKCPFPPLRMPMPLTKILLARMRSVDCFQQKDYCSWSTKITEVVKHTLHIYCYHFCWTIVSPWFYHMQRLLFFIWRQVRNASYQDYSSHLFDQHFWLNDWLMDR